MVKVEPGVTNREFSAAYSPPPPPPVRPRSGPGSGVADFSPGLALQVADVVRDGERSGRAERLARHPRPALVAGERAAGACVGTGRPRRLSCEARAGPEANGEGAGGCGPQRKYEPKSKRLVRPSSRPLSGVRDERPATSEHRSRDVRDHRWPLAFSRSVRSFAQEAEAMANA